MPCSIKHKFWVEWGSNTTIGLPWTNPKNGKPRNFSKSSFKGYGALEKGLNNVIAQNLHINIPVLLISKQIQKLKVMT